MEKSKEAKSEMITVEGLIKIKKLNIISTFSDNKKIQPMIDKVKKEVAVDSIDLKTKKGRDEIASRAYKVSKMKGAVVKQIIDPSVEEYKAAVKSVGAGKKHWNDEMDALRDEVRAPLNKWEAEEKVSEEKRISDIKNKISGIINLSVLPSGHEWDKNYTSEMIEAVDNIDCSEGFDEFAQEALQAKSSAKEALAQCLNNIIQKEIEEQNRIKLADEQEKLDKERLDMELKAKAQERLNTLVMIPSTMFGKTSVELNKKLNSIDLVEINEAEFGELLDQANIAKNKVIVQLGKMAEQQALVESAQIKTNDAELKSRGGNDIVNNTHEVAKILDRAGADGNAARIEPVCNDEKPDEQPKLSNKDQMMKMLRFWQSEYGVRDGEFNDLLVIINQYI